MKFPEISTVEEFEKHFAGDFWLTAARDIFRHHALSFGQAKRIEACEHVVFLVDEAFVLKIYSPFRNGFRRERKALEFARGKTSLPVPEILFEGELEGFDYLVLEYKPGAQMTRENWLKLNRREQIEILSQLATGLKELHSHDSEAIEFDWRKFIENQVLTVFERQKRAGANPEWLERLPFYLEENLQLLSDNKPDVFLHGDVHFGNLRFINEAGKWRISGLFDFADSLKGFREYDFLAIGVLIMQGQGDLQREFFRAYGYPDSEINESLRRRMMLLTILYECSNLRKYALHLRPEAVNYTLDRLEREIWAFCQ